MQLPEFVREPFSAAMSQSMLLPAFIALFGVTAALFMVGFTASAFGGVPARRRAGTGDDAQDHADGLDAEARRIRLRPDDLDDNYDSDSYDDDDDYVEYTLSRAPSASREPARGVKLTQTCADEDDTEPLTAHAEHPRVPPAEMPDSSSVESSRSLLDEPITLSEIRSISFAHNGFHVDDEQRFRPIEQFAPQTVELGRSDDSDEQFFDDIETYDGPGDCASHPGGTALQGERCSGDQRPPRHELTDDPPESPNAHHHAGRVRHRLSESKPPPNRHYRVNPDDTANYGRHSLRYD